MGTTRQLPDISNNVDTEQKFPILSLAERLFVGDSQLRNKLKHYTKFDLINSKFDCLLSDLQIPEFVNYLSVTSKVHGALKIVDTALHGVTQVILLLTRCETLTAIIRISALSERERDIRVIFREICCN